MNDPILAAHDELAVEQPISVSHLVKVLKTYSATIFLSLAAVAIAYAVFAAIFYLAAPSTRVITQPFSLDFKGAERGEYPNGTKFSVNEIIAEPILALVYKQTGINQYMSFRNFVGSMYISESNPEYEKLWREYAPRLSDPKLTSAERQQVEKEFAEKKESLKKNLYAIHFTSPQGVKNVPDEIAKRALSATLARWADWAQVEGRVTSYNTTILSPAVLDDTPRSNQVIAIRILIKRLAQVLDNIDTLEQLPSADVARTPADHLSLAELRIKIEDLIRFRLEPNVAAARAAQGPSDPSTVRFVQTQLAYDQRQLQGYQDHINAIRDALTMYTTQRPVAGESTTAAKPAPGPNPQQETVMPQVSDTFIDRMAQLLNSSADVQYRQRIVNEMRRVQNDMMPAQEAVRYDQEMLRDLTTPVAPTASTADVTAEVENVRNDAKLLVQKVNDIYQVMSKNLNPETYLYTTSEAPTAYVVRSFTVKRLALLGIVVLLLALAVIVFLCFMHNRVREEETIETASTPSVTHGPPVSVRANS